MQPINRRSRFSLSPMPLRSDRRQRHHQRQRHSILRTAPRRQKPPRHFLGSWPRGVPVYRIGSMYGPAAGGIPSRCGLRFRSCSTCEDHYRSQRRHHPRIQPQHGCHQTGTHVQCGLLRRRCSSSCRQAQHLRSPHRSLQRRHPRRSLPAGHQIRDTHERCGRACRIGNTPRHQSGNPLRPQDPEGRRKICGLAHRRCNTSWAADQGNRGSRGQPCCKSSRWENQCWGSHWLGGQARHS